MIEEMQDFINYMDDYADSSEATVENYQRWLAEFCTISGINDMAEFNALGISQLEQYINVLKKKNQISSIWTKAIALQSFYSWAVSRKKCPYNMIKDVKLPKRPIKEFTPPSQAQVLAILEQAKKNKTYFTIFTLITQTGLRISEATGAKLSCMIDNSIRIQGKGNKERTVYLQPGMMDLLNDYIANHRKEKEIVSESVYLEKNFNALYTSYDSYVERLTEAKDLIFLSNRGGELDPRNVNSALKRYAKKAKVDMDKYQIKNHKLRTYFATNAVIHHGVGVKQMQEMLGHKSIETTMGYLRMSQEEKKASYDKIPDIGEHFAVEGGTC